MKFNYYQIVNYLILKMTPGDINLYITLIKFIESFGNISSIVPISSVKWFNSRPEYQIYILDRYILYKCINNI